MAVIDNYNSVYPESSRAEARAEKTIAASLTPKKAQANLNIDITSKSTLASTAPTRTSAIASTSTVQSVQIHAQPPKFTSTHAHSPLRISTPAPAYPFYQDLTPLIQDLKTRLDSFLVTYVWWMKVQALTGTGHGNHSPETLKGGFGPGLEDKMVQEEQEVEKSDGSKEIVTGHASLGSNGDRTPGGFNKFEVQPQTDIPVTGNSDDKEFVPSSAAPVAFSFDGEYSIIAPRENAEGKPGLEQTWRRVAMVVREIQRGTGLKFKCVALLKIVDTPINPFPAGEKCDSLLHHQIRRDNPAVPVLTSNFGSAFTYTHCRCASPSRSSSN